MRSASDTLTGLQSKLEEYIANGALLGWLIDRKNRTVYISTYISTVLNGNRKF
ncbi:PDDEXK family nuclease [Leptothermofonsia sichuanensis]|uniref:hypothetical protein n=1 Tax=Leptothermofonsia sichuanensis TaxID=2917832 RepID=UPI0036F27B36